MTNFNTSAFAAQQQLISQATKLQQTGRWQEAIPLLERAAANDPKNFTILLALAQCQVTCERLVAARENLKKVMKLAPKDARAHQFMAYSWKREGAFDKAVAAINEAIALEPALPHHVAVKAEILHMAGRSDEAMQALEPILAKHGKVPMVASIFGTISMRLKRQREAIPLLEAVLGNLDLPPTARLKYSFDIAAIYDSIGEYDKAWVNYVRGNSMKHEKWNPAEHTKLVDAVMSAWTRPTIASLPKPHVDGSPFVFIVGMPRSGTTLVEQIISTSPGVHAAGERNELLKVAHDVSNSMAMGIPMAWDLTPLMTQDAVERHARTYVTPMRALGGGKSTRVTDKMPPNFLNLGLVQALLPGARAIHCRREAMDSCLSCFFQLFGGTLPFAYDLDHCGKFYVDYERIMAHWKKELDLPILDVQYEELVENQEAGTRRIFEFLGLPYTEQALRFHESTRTTLTASNQQVREPIHRRSIQRWKHYEKHLAPLRAALGQYAPT